MKVLLRTNIIILAMLGSMAMSPFTVNAQTSSLAQQLAGRILLQVEQNGEAWYVEPQTLKRYYLGRPDDAFRIMRELGLGVSESDFANFESSGAPARLAGRILLRVNANGEAYYVEPFTHVLDYLGRPADAFRVMREQGLGITNNDLALVVPADVAGTAVTPPFTSQAPLGEWYDSRFQDGCEEAAALMAVYWAQGKTLTVAQARAEIIKMAAYQSELFGEYRDTSAADTLARLVKGYLGYDQATLRLDVNLADIIDEIKAGKVVIVPASGRDLGNPNFVPPGPLHHALLIHGYDEAAHEFITHDPGTRNGENYRYDEWVLYSAIRDYPSGYHEDWPSVKKNVIVVAR